MGVGLVVGRQNHKHKSATDTTADPAIVTAGSLVEMAPAGQRSCREGKRWASKEGITGFRRSMGTTLSLSPKTTSGWSRRRGDRAPLDRQPGGGDTPLVFGGWGVAGLYRARGRPLGSVSRVRARRARQAADVPGQRRSGPGLARWQDCLCQRCRTAIPIRPLVVHHRRGGQRTGKA